MARSLITPLVVQFQNLTEDEQKIFLDLVDPQPEPEAPTKQKRKKTKRAEPLSEERRTAIHRKGIPPVAPGVAAAVKNSIEQGKQSEPDAKCVAKVPGLDVECGEPKDALIHNPNGGYASYHEFQAPKSKKAASQK